MFASINLLRIHMAGTFTIQKILENIGLVFEGLLVGTELHLHRELDQQLFGSNSAFRGSDKRVRVLDHFIPSESSFLPGT